MRKMLAAVVMVSAGAVGMAEAAPIIRITEWMYNSDEFIEITNIGDSAQDLTGWSYDDSSRTAGAFSLSALGILSPGASAIISEQPADAFRARWNIPASVAIVGGNDQNLGRSDEINIFDGASNLIDRLTYADQSGNGPRTLEISGNLPLSALGLNNATLAVLSVDGDVYGSYSVPEDVTAEFGAATANPGIYTPAVIPEPSMLGLLPLAGLTLARRRK